MRTQYFSLRLLSNTILSQSSATAGDHQSLDFIPGSVLLGVAAGRLYSQLDAASADLLFQSGSVRFGDALPSGDGEPAFPLPLCWHHIKGERSHERCTDGDYQLAANLFDPSRQPPESGKQPKQLRAGHVTAAGRLLLAEKDYELKTAIDARKGSAAQSQLFGYQSLRAGQAFIFALTADDSVDEVLFAKLVASLAGPVRLGRSRSAQFGQGQISPIAAPAALATAASNDALRLWLLSDLALLDDFGNPMLTPNAAAFGLPAGSQWCAEQSFIRTRSYTPFNAKRRCYDLQRQLISRGSVLVFKLARPLSAEELAALRFVGQYQGAGLGQLAVNPALLASASPSFSTRAGAPLKAVGKTAVADPGTVLSRHLQRKLGRGEEGRAVEEAAQALVRELQRALDSAARWAGLPVGQLPVETPVRSQWGHLREVAQASVDATALRCQLFEGEHAVLRPRAGQASWGLQINAGEQLQDAIRQALQAVDERLQPRVLAHACTQLMKDKRLTQAEEKR